MRSHLGERIETLFFSRENIVKLYLSRVCVRCEICERHAPHSVRQISYRKITLSYFILHPRLYLRYNIFLQFHPQLLSSFISPAVLLYLLLLRVKYINKFLIKRKQDFVNQFFPYVIFNDSNPLRLFIHGDSVVSAKNFIARTNTVKTAGKPYFFIDSCRANSTSLDQ